ncbi:DUF3160 domain-containing protein [Aquimarina addita]|uniref:DUF3160 domain-containing protein n=1 Tax=Aquimarina addita TaxID=870485 RepID=A0ABP7X9Q4_9FLAO
MKKQLLFTCLVTLLMACGGNEKSKDKKNEKVSETKEEVKQPEETITQSENLLITDGQIDVNALGGDVDLTMDISGLNLYDIRILRNSFSAKQGYCFMKADIRYVFEATDWYTERMEKRYWAEEGGDPVDPISYSDEETLFIEKLKKREEELKTQNLIGEIGGQQPNMNNIVNLFQLENPDPKLMSMLGKHGFAIVPNTNIQLFHLYEENDYSEFPNFVTTDMYMQLFHMYFGYVLRKVEEGQFIPLLSQICQTMVKDMKDFEEANSDESLKALAKFNQTYYAIAYSVLTDKTLPVPEGYGTFFKEEIGHIEEAEDSVSDFLEYTDVQFPYSLFKPRGHYTRTKELQRYFKAMMWLQTAPFCLKNDTQLKRAILSASMIQNNEETLKKYNAIMEPINFIIGEPDNVSFLDLVSMLEESDYLLQNLLTKEESLENFRENIQKIADAQNKIGPKGEGGSCKDKINFIPQRYLSDNEVLQELVDLKNKPTKRGYPKGLDIMAAFGSASAENLLLNELEEGEKWDKYPALLSDMTVKMKDVDWDATLYNKWIYSLLELQKPNTSYPYFMQSSQWHKKDLNASLASWAELKHDAILYAEQPMGAECGGGEEVPAPYVLGYVEPNIGYWNAVIELLDLTTSVLEKNKLIDTNISRITRSLKENAEFLLSASKKELAGKKLTVQEYSQIELIGSTFEWLTLDLVKQDDEYVDGWDKVKGPDKSIAVVADIYTANSNNNPDKGILHVATGNVNDIYVIVEIEGYLYITKGAVFGYHEFHLPPGNRLTDEEWQEMLEKNEATGIPSWMSEIIAPIDVPETNEKIFYSSGC